MRLKLKEASTDSKLRHALDHFIKSLSSDISQDEIVNFTKASHYLTQRMCEGDVRVDFTRRDYDGLVCAATKVDKVYCEIEDMTTKTIRIMRNVLEFLKARYYQGLCEALSGFSDNYIREKVCLSSFLF